MNTTEHYQATGLAVTIGGLERARDLLQEEIDTLSAQLAALRGIKRKKGKPRDEEESAFKWEKRNSDRRTGISAYWANMSPEERSAEVRRRRALGKRNAKRRKPSARQFMNGVAKAANGAAA